MRASWSKARFAGAGPAPGVPASKPKLSRNSASDGTYGGTTIEARLIDAPPMSLSVSRTCPSRIDRIATLLALWLAALAAPALAADEAGVATPVAHARIGFERIKFPGDERVGLVGTSYLIDVASIPGLSAGPAVYGAITGRRGGFFTLGGELAWRRQLAGPLGVEIGLYAGGGGGAGAPQGGGLMLRPHADLLWDFGPYALGLSLSRVRFPNGQIDSTQVGFVFNAINDFRYVPAARLSSAVRSGGRAGFGFDRVQIVSGIYRTQSGLTLADGRPLRRDIGYLGVRAEQAFSEYTYWGLEANGAAQRSVAGYAEYLGTLGAETEVVRNRVNVGARVALGMAGGGGIQTAGGVLAKAAVYSVVRISPEFGLSLEAGAANAPRGRFRAAYASAALVWALDGPDSAGMPTRPTRTDFSAGVERFDAVRRDGSTRALQADVLKINRFLSPEFYLAGQVHSAIGGGAGGYSSALIGAGWTRALGAGIHVGAELLGGASGGGGVDSRGGIVQPMAYLGYQLSPSVALRVGAGQVKALHGPLSSPVVDLSLSITYGVSAGS